MKQTLPSLDREEVLSRMRSVFTETGVEKIMEWGLGEQVYREASAEIVTERIFFGPAEIQAWKTDMMEKARKQMTGASLEQVAAQVAAELPRRIRREKLLAFKRQYWGEELPSLFLKHKAHLDRVTFSLIRVHDVGLAREIYCRLREGEQTFAEAAHEFSAADAANGAIQGPVPLSSPHPDLARALQAAEPGEVLPPRKIAQWHVIVRLEKRLPAQLDEATSTWLLDRAYEEWLRDQFQPVAE